MVSTSDKFRGRQTISILLSASLGALQLPQARTGRHAVVTNSWVFALLQPTPGLLGPTVDWCWLAAYQFLTTQS
jgi:hypothetical protein